MAYVSGNTKLLSLCKCCKRPLILDYMRLFIVKVTQDIPTQVGILLGK